MGYMYTYRYIYTK